MLRGGTEAPEGVYDFVVQVRIRAVDDELGLCGGTLISPEFVLTAAHCIENPTLRSMLFGEQRTWSVDQIMIIPEHRLSLSAHPREVHSVDQFFIHPLRKPSKTPYDFALLRLSKPIFTKHKVHLAADSHLTEENQAVLALGWGPTSFRGSFSSVLNEAQYTLLSNTRCQIKIEGYLGRRHKIAMSQLCVDNKNGGRPMHGDSGGPLLANAASHPVLVGVYSYSIHNSLGAIGVPSIYGRVSTIVDFIDQHVQGHVWRREDAFHDALQSSAELEEQEEIFFYDALQI